MYSEILLEKGKTCPKIKEGIDDQKVLLVK